MRIVEIRERRVPISSEIRNAYISFNTMDVSLVAVITDVIHAGTPVVGFGLTRTDAMPLPGCSGTDSSRGCSRPNPRICLMVRARISIPRAPGK